MSHKFAHTAGHQLTTELACLCDLLLLRLHGQAVPTRTILAHYHALSPHGEKDFIGLFTRVDVWYDGALTHALARQAKVFYAPEIPADHPDHLLTSYGHKRNLMDVAQTFLELQTRGQLPDHRYIRNIQWFIGQFRSGITLPRVIIVMGRIRHVPYIIDGNTRSIAAAISALEDGTHFPYLQAYVGRVGLFRPLFNLPI